MRNSKWILGFKVLNFVARSACFPREGSRKINKYEKLVKEL
jgi:hypothetical protein